MDIEKHSIIGQTVGLTLPESAVKPTVYMSEHGQ